MLGPDDGCEWLKHVAILSFNKLTGYIDSLILSVIIK
jgi:hypothetical protein